MIFPLPHIFRPRMLRTGVLGLLAAGLMASTALAEVTPRTGPHDNRVRIATWTEGQVYRIVTTLTRVTTVEFGEGETIRSIIAGDTVGFQFDGARCDGRRAQRKLCGQRARGVHADRRLG